MPLQSGEVLNNRYRIVKLLGKGGFGAVYRAWDINLECACAIKENFDTSAEAIRQFKTEASLLHKLRHPNLPLVFDHFSIPGQGQYLVMDFVEGQDLQEMLDRRGDPLPENEVLPWLGQVCDALAYLHSQTPPIIHRDIKPANIKITPQGKAVLVDFGIAKVFDPQLSTTVGARAITPGYSPHEQYGQGKTDIRTDVYALGATLYTLLTGLVPVESIQRVISDPLTPPELANPAISPGVADTIRRAMQPDPDRRIKNTTDFKAALQRADTVTATLPLPQPSRTQPSDLQGGTTQVLSAQAAPGKGALLKKWLPWAAGSILVILAVALAWPGGIASQFAAPATSTPGKTQTVQAFIPSPTLTAGSISTPVPTGTFTREPSPIPLLETKQPGTPTRTSTPGVGSTFVSPKDGMKMVYIPPGLFDMGGESPNVWDEKPVHTVFLDSYWIDQTEVTNAQYEICVREGGCEAPCRKEGCPYEDPENRDHPVVNVNWFAANSYCEWAGRRLPTEAQWEKAARGGLAGEIYPWGNEAPVCKAESKNGAQTGACDGDTVPVMSFAANGFGLYDVAGNVLEWTYDWYDSTYYHKLAATNPNGPDDGVYRTLRGGSWLTQSAYGYGTSVRVSDRDRLDPNFSGNYIGFRCVLPAPEQTGGTTSEEPASTPDLTSRVESTANATETMNAINEQATDQAVSVTNLSDFVVSVSPSGISIAASYSYNGEYGEYAYFSAELRGVSCSTTYPQQISRGKGKVTYLMSGCGSLKSGREYIVTAQLYLSNTIIITKDFTYTHP